MTIRSVKDNAALWPIVPIRNGSRCVALRYGYEAVGVG